jgi:capsular polysaccharide biosynthesis protein
VLGETGVALLDDIEVRGQQSMPAIGDAFITDWSAYDASAEAGEQPVKFKDSVPLAGTVLNLNTTFTLVNYGHAFLDGISRIGVLLQAGVDATGADHVLMPGFRSEVLTRVVELAGYPRDKQIVATHGARYQCERLIQPTFPGTWRHYTGASAVMARSLDVAGATGRRRRLMILRKGGHREIANYDEIAALADEFDLELYDPAASPFSPADFVEAELVVGAHGAAFADIGFCPEGMPFLEFIPSSHQVPYYMTLATTSGLQWSAVKGRSEAADQRANFSLNVDEVRFAIDAAASKV